MNANRKAMQRLVLSAAAVLPIAALLASCAHFVAPAPGNVSPEGVRLTIRDFECSEVAETTDSKKTADLLIDLEISNQSPVPLVVGTGAMQVVDAEGGSMTRRGWRQKEPVQVAAGSRQSLTMHFLGSTRHCCSSRLSLTPSGVTVGERTLALGSIDFVPACLF
jgi:hypothetical protein